MVEADDGNGGVTTVAISINLNDIIDENPLGLGEEKTVVLYPNPVDKFLRIQSSSPLELTDLSMYTLGGRQLKIDPRPFGVSELEVDLSQFEKGIYILSVRTGMNKQEQVRVYKN